MNSDSEDQLRLRNTELEGQLTDAARTERAQERTNFTQRDALSYATSILDTVREPLLVLDGELRLKTASRAFFQTFGVLPEETIGQLLYELGNGQWNIPALRTLLEEVLPKESSVVDFEVVHKFPALGRRVMLLNARALWSDGKRAELFLLAIEDITERKRIAEELARSNSTQRDALAYALSIVDTVREPLLVLDGELRLKTASRAFYQTFAALPEETIGRFLYDLGNGQWDIPALRTLLEEVLPKERSVLNFVVVHEFPGLGRRVMLLNARELWSESKDSKRVLLAIEDITERKRIEEELVRSNEDLQRFAYVVAHDLRSPLNGALNLLKLLAVI